MLAGRRRRHTRTTAPPLPARRSACEATWRAASLRLAGHEQVCNVSGGFKSYADFKAAQMAGMSANGAKL